MTSGVHKVGVIEAGETDFDSPFLPHFPLLILDPILPGVSEFAMAPVFPAAAPAGRAPPSHFVVGWDSF
jgi:hypothetical protein